MPDDGKDDKPTHSSQIVQSVVFWGLLLVAVGIRLPGVTRPLVGNFATKSTIYAMIARNRAEGRAGLLYPTIDCLRGGRRSLHMLEFPASAHLTGLCWRTMGGSLDVWGRATSIVFSAASVGLLYYWVRRRHGFVAAVGAGAAFALSPVGIIYGQTFMLEASLAFFILATFAALDRWKDHGNTLWLVVAGGAFALGALTKIYVVVFLLPLAFELARRTPNNGQFGAIESCATKVAFRSAKVTLLSWSERRHRWRLAIDNAGLNREIAIAALTFIVALVPAALWYWHAARTASPESPLAGQVFYSVRQGAAVHWPPHPLLQEADFYRQMLDDLAGVLLTPIGLALCMAGLMHPASRRYGPWLIASAALVALLPRKFYEMNYYWLAVLPVLSILVGLGWQLVYRCLAVQTSKRSGRSSIGVLVLVSLLFSFRYAVKPAFLTPEEDRAVVTAGEAVQRLAAPGEPVVTMHGSTTDLLYYSNRPGWVVSPDTPELDHALEDCHRQGARLLVIAGPVPDRLAAGESIEPQPLRNGDGFAIYRLRGP